MRRILSNRHRRRLLGLGVAVAVVAVAAAVPALSAAGQTPSDARVAAGGPTAAVVVTDLSSSVTFEGSLATSATRTVTNQRTGDGEPGEVVQQSSTVAASSSPGEAVSLSRVGALGAQVGEPTTTTTEPPPTDPSTTTTTVPATTTTEPATTTTSEPPVTEPATTTSTAPSTTTTTAPATTTTAACLPADDPAATTTTTMPDPATTTTTVDPAVTTTSTTVPEPECPTDTTDARPPGGGGGGGGGVAPGGGAGLATGAQPEAAGAGGGAGGGGDQTVTWITGAGETLEHGEVAFGVDGVPTIVLYGDAPAWRDLSADSEAGADIAQLEAGLVMLGFASADELTLDQTFDADTTAAVEAFQEAYGFEVDGTVELGDVLFLSGPVTVTSSVQLGDAVGQGSEMLTVAAGGRSVSLDVDAAEVTMLAAGTTVDVEVGGSIVSGTVVEVGRDALAASDDVDPTVAVTVELTDPAAVAAVPDGADATITLPQESHADVLAVPAGALHAGPEGGAAVTVVHADGTRSEVPVTPGFESGGVVEIVEGDLTENDLVALG